MERSAYSGRRNSSREIHTRPLPVATSQRSPRVWQACKHAGLFRPYLQPGLGQRRTPPPNATTVSTMCLRLCELTVFWPRTAIVVVSSGLRVLCGCNLCRRAGIAVYWSGGLSHPNSISVIASVHGRLPIHRDNDITPCAHYGYSTFYSLDHKLLTLVLEWSVNLILRLSLVLYAFQWRTEIGLSPAPFIFICGPLHVAS